MQPHSGLRMTMKTQQRLALFGRLRMADWIEMPEKEFAREIEKVEKDPLFQKLYFGSGEAQGAIRRQRWPGGRLSGSFYEVNERISAGRERVPVEERLGEKSGLTAKIRKMGQEAFEKYFLHAEEPLSLAEIAARTGLSLDDVRAINDFLLEMGAREEFAGPGREPALVRAYTCLARLSLDETVPGFEFFSPHWARGLYQIRYDILERWKEEGRLEADDRRRLPHLLKRLETLNLRQSTLFRILESLSKLQTEYLRTRREENKRPISLRQLAQRLDLAPSTVSRALTGRSVQLPWGKEVPLITLVPGRRRVLREIMGLWLETGARATDASLVERLKSEYGIRVSRRTVNAVRNELGKKKP